ncbi:hypothetical protein CCL09_01960 [Pseudomonas congelans]|nr:hypothetical protein IV03_02740 [Pseudomonas congelans]PBP90338.1 hypothetical protein CCL07_24010 [Pseudomonas congelans]PBP97048.1 hypothetical protein CCL17_22155 [Pseudomonas congelans]PBQ16937.1 hypothetical protein CCL08_15075 [Pseudomonas congelans]PBQ20879.1 hypothetical protein CCL09_01960 [Pseudomonas congelans]
MGALIVIKRFTYFIFKVRRYSVVMLLAEMVYVLFCLWEIIQLRRDKVIHRLSGFRRQLLPVA